MITTNLSAGQWMKQRRKDLGLTQEALAERAGCSWETVRKIEAGTLRPSQQLAELLAAQLDVPPQERPAVVGRLRAPTLTAKVAPVASVAALSTHPLPIPPTLLIGRTAEVVRLQRLLLQTEARLVTLLGPPGIGKTRLALETAATLREAFVDGVCFVELAPLTDPALVVPTVAKAFGVRESSGQPLLDTLSASLRDKHVLLVLDNCEHLPVVAVLVDTLLRAAPGLKALATSRTPLRLYGEKEFPVPALRLPTRPAGSSPQELEQYEAVQLFVERARDVQPDFALTAENAGAVAEICTRLDGLPLAIELAAARIRLLPPPALVARLSRRLAVLSGGARNLPARQQTVRGAITWSYDLLDAGEQQLLRRLAVFQGEWTLEAIAAVCDIEGDLLVDLLDGVESLVRKSLLQQRARRNGDPGFWMLETIHEYAWEKLETQGEAEVLRRQHARYFLQLAEADDWYQAWPQEFVWLDRLAADHDNSRAALKWLLDQTGDPQAEKLEWGLRLAGALCPFWSTRGYNSEGRRWLTTALEAFAKRQAVDPESMETPALDRARYIALYSSGMLAWIQGADGAARTFFEQSLAISRVLQDPHRILLAVLRVGSLAAVQGDSELARTCFAECLAISREVGDQWGINAALNNLGCMALEQGDYAAAGVLLNESLTSSRALGHKHKIAITLINLGAVALYQGDYATAQALLQESLLGNLALSDTGSIAGGLAVMAALEAQRRRESPPGQAPAGETHGTQGAGIHPWGDGEIAAAAKRAAKLLGAVDGILETVVEILEPMEGRMYAQAGALAHDVLDAAALTAARREGRAMTVVQAVAYACADDRQGG